MVADPLDILSHMALEINDGGDHAVQKHGSARWWSRNPQKAVRNASVPTVRARNVRQYPMERTIF